MFDKPQSLDERHKEMISRLMAYHLRHNPDVQRTPEGFVEIDKIVQIIKEKIYWVEPSHIREVAIFDPKARYEVKENLIRARYGHSVDVKLDFPEASVDLLYYGTVPEAVEKIISDGLMPGDRNMVHLSATVENATDVGKIRSPNPVVLVIDAKLAREKGIKIQKASDKIFLVKSVPPECIKRLER